MANYIYKLFTKEEVQELMYGGTLYCKDEEDEDTEDVLYEVVQEKFYSSDQEKNSTTYEYIIKDIVNNKFYKEFEDYSISQFGIKYTELLLRGLK